MRLIVVLLVLLTGLKVWTQDRMHRAVLGDALIGAYRVRAVEACGRELPKAARTQVALSNAPSPWGTAAAAEIVFGNGDVDVAVWDTENPLWLRRFRNPNLVLTSANAAKARCSYDVVSGAAKLSTN